MIDQYIISLCSKKKYAGRGSCNQCFQNKEPKSDRRLLAVKEIASKYLQFVRLRAFSWVSFDLIQRMDATPLFHSFVVNHCDSAKRLAAFVVQNDVS